MERRIVAKASLENGGHYAYSYVSESYPGPVAVVNHQNRKAIVVLPSLGEAEKFAAYAISPSGGLCEVSVEEAMGRRCTHLTFEQWLLG